MPTYRQVQENQSSSHGGTFLAACVIASTLAMPPANAGMAGTFLQQDAIAIAAVECEYEADRIISRIMNLTHAESLRDEGEVPPPQIVVDRLVQLIRDAAGATLAMPHAQVSSFYGEVNVTWRIGDRIIKLAAFPDRPTLLQTGSILMQAGSFRAEPNPSPQRIADEINSLLPANDPEEQVSPG